MSHANSNAHKKDFVRSTPLQIDKKHEKLLNSWPAHVVEIGSKSAKNEDDRAWIRDQLEAVKPDPEYQLLFRASEDGFDAASFHKACDGHSPTLVLADTSLGLWGGFTTVAWDSKSYNKEGGSGHFVFSSHLKKSFPYGGTGKVIYCDSESGPVFGTGNDFHIGSDLKSGYSKVGNYRKEGQNYQFTIHEVEVFKIV